MMMLIFVICCKVVSIEFMKIILVKLFLNNLVIFILFLFFCVFVLDMVILLVFRFSLLVICLVLFVFL